MVAFNRGGSDRGPRNFDRRAPAGRSFGGGGRGGFGKPGAKPFMHDATCSKCGNACQLPFKPSGERAVFCSNCFEKKENTFSSASSRPERPSFDKFDKPRVEEKRLFTATCSKCGNSCEVPFKPLEGKPVFCVNCFEKKGGSGGAAELKDLKEWILKLNIKLDTILKLLSPAGTTAKATKEVVAKEIKEEKKDKEVAPKAKAAAKKVVAKKKK